MIFHSIYFLFNLSVLVLAFYYYLPNLIHIKYLPYK